MDPPPNMPLRPFSFFPPSFSLIIFLGLFEGSVDEREAAGEGRREGDADGPCLELDGCRAGAEGRARTPLDVGDPELVGDGPVGSGLRILPLPLGSGVFCCCACCAVDNDPALSVDVDEVMETSTLDGGVPFLGGGAAAAKDRATGVATMESAGRTALVEESMRDTRCLPSGVNLL